MESGWIALIVLVGACVFSWLWSLLTAPRFSVHGKHVLFTGTETPLGLAVAKKYVKKGANVTLIGPAMEILEATQSELQKSKRLTPRATDHVVYAASRRIKPGYFWEQDVASMKEAMDVNYLGAVAALPAMIKAKTRGRIVFVSSVDSLEFPVGCGACSGSKSAIRGLADSSRNELLQYNMSVAAIPHSQIKVWQQRNREVDKQAQVVVIDGLWLGQYSITTTWNGFLLRMLSNGVEPRNNNFLECIFPLLCRMHRLVLAHV
ncbi:uncharacterized protein PITG_02585 [Phytophthora infestans T30-4]|uniref:Uncharacterized protein n=1 Tax=Phytophthora infestans (strain T30-4) TaxID=403677 RepID=D0MWQ2_PHYIT|nr:uncharacterized protein PITG_02585 [Phytophthora infestans T30-4]EEY64065.1 conserved hypothetical protein [Phytophthora infestans T30-4]|eukprot:XP_002907501.1 conserved hypothetical protein [Phytophthora infestans T30-4]